MEVRPAHTLLSGWSSIRLSSPRIDAASIDTHTGITLGSKGWIGFTSRTQWLNSYVETDSVTIDSVFSGGILSHTNTTRHTTTYDSHYRAEFGLQFTWFQPPYRPTIRATYDAVDRHGFLVNITIPYTVRLPWFPPTTFMPELSIRITPLDSDRMAFQYVSFSGLFEVSKGAFTIVPVAAVVPKGSNLGDWLPWGGVHVGVAF